MNNPCKACAEPICMGVCSDQVEYQEYLERIRQQIIELNGRGERGQKEIKTVHTAEKGTENAG